MTGPTTTATQAARLHDVLLRLGGRLPDDLLARARQWLAEGQLAEVAGVAADAAADGLFTPSAQDREVLAALVPAERLGEPVPATGVDWHFAPLLPRDDSAIPVALDLTVGNVAGTLGDPADAAAAREAAQSPGAVALWRAWRAPSELNPRPAAVYLLQTTAADPELPAITAALQATLRAAGIEHPQAEVFGTRTAPPPYQRLARGRSALLWATTPPAEVTIAREFDRVDPVLGPQFHADHPTLAPGEEADRVLAYLAAGESLLTTTAREADVADGAAGDVVPQGFRTDGTWIWTESVAYYLRTHALSPDSRLLEHLRGRDYTPPPLDDVLRHRATVELWRPADEGAPA